MKGYKSAIVATLKQEVWMWDPYICRLLNNFYMDTPVEVSLVPSWDLTKDQRCNQVPFQTTGYGFHSVEAVNFQNGFPYVLASGASEGKYTL